MFAACYCRLSFRLFLIFQTVGVFGRDWLKKTKTTNMQCEKGRIKSRHCQWNSLVAKKDFSVLKSISLWALWYYSWTGVENCVKWNSNAIAITNELNAFNELQKWHKYTQYHSNFKIYFSHLKSNERSVYPSILN